MKPRRSELDLFNALQRDGSQADLAEFSERLRRCVYWVLNRMATGRSLFGEVDEIVDEAYLRLEHLRQRGFSGGPREFKSYLYKVVVSVCVVAANRRRLTSSLDAPVTLPDGEEKPLADVLHELVDSQIAADAAIERAEVGALVRRALEHIDERCRALLERFYLEDASVKEIAHAGGTRPNTIEVALTRCRHRLYGAFLSLYVDQPDASWREQVAAAGKKLPGVLSRVFSAWWAENRSVLDVGKEIGMSPSETRRLLAQAKLGVWQQLSEEGAP